MQEIKIRMASAEDAGAVRNIYAPYVEHTTVTFEYEVPAQEEMQRRITTTLAQYPYLICEYQGETVGYAYASSYRGRQAFNWDCELSVYLSEQAKGRGIGRALYEAVLELVTCQGYYNAYGVISLPNESSLGLHKKLGFVLEGTQQQAGYKKGRWIDLTYHKKKLREYDHPDAFPVSVQSIDQNHVNEILAKYEKQLM